MLSSSRWMSALVTAFCAAAIRAPPANTASTSASTPINRLNRTTTSSVSEEVVQEERLTSG